MVPLLARLLELSAEMPIPLSPTVMVALLVRVLKLLALMPIRLAPAVRMPPLVTVLESLTPIAAVPLSLTVAPGSTLRVSVLTPTPA